MKKYLGLSVILLFGMALLSSCCKKIYPEATVVHDTVTVSREVRVRDTVLKAPGASVGLHFTPIELMNWAHEGTKSTTIRTNRNKQAKVEVKVNQSGMTVNCDCDTAAITAKLYDTYQKEQHSSTITKTLIKREKYTPKFVKFLAWCGGAFWLLVGGLIVKKFWL